MAINSLAGTNGSLPFGPSAATGQTAPPMSKAKAADAKAAAAAGDANGALGPTSSAADQSNRFLKMLVAQMSNQDPLNPMDSAQVTSQMAQISTVEGVQTLNKTVGGLGTQFTQGNITPTGNPMDLAINGNGFFQTQDASNQIEYTRNGQFKVSADGNIVNDQNNKLLGFAADDQGNIMAGAAVPLQLPTGGINPKATTTSTIEFNLDARESVTKPTTGPTMAPRRPMPIDQPTPVDRRKVS